MYVPYFLFRLGFEPYEAMWYPNLLLGSKLYALAMFWPHLTFHEARRWRDVVILLVLLLVVDAVCCFVSASTASGIRQFSFVPFYIVSLASLFQNKAWDWFVGLAWGWIGPLLLNVVVGDGLYDYLVYSDLYITFPLCVMGSLRLALSGGAVADGPEVGDSGAGLDDYNVSYGTVPQ